MLLYIKIEEREEEEKKVTGSNPSPVEMSLMIEIVNILLLSLWDQILTQVHILSTSKFSHHNHICNSFLVSSISYEFMGLFVICLHNRFHMFSFNGSLVTAIKPKAKYKFHTVTMLMSHILQKKITYFPKICYYTLSQYSKLSTASVVTTSQVRASALLLLLNAGSIGCWIGIH